jgi:hypothetical protein
VRSMSHDTIAFSHTSKTRTARKLNPGLLTLQEERFLLSVFSSHDKKNQAKKSAQREHHC